MSQNVNTPPDKHVKVLHGQGWVGLVNNMGNETTVVNAARVSFGKMKDSIDKRDQILIKYLLDNRHSSPFEHVQYTFIVHCPLFVRSQWHRHRTWAYNEISRRYTEVGIEFYNPQILRKQAENDRQASVDADGELDSNLQTSFSQFNQKSYDLYNELLGKGVCREQARGVLTQNLMTTFWASVNLHNLIHFLELRDSSHAQAEIQEYAVAIKKLIKPTIPYIAEILNW
ncbi:MAG: FAD-dependent thymidylate synthase [Verrucomicrobiota bacterium]|nr:FAD-dependent thymidylate synthase [Verrucomicrobiota bacterium]